eukprot:1142851-Pelagomonas_calceolata.AAC.2
MVTFERHCRAPWRNYPRFPLAGQMQMQESQVQQPDGEWSAPRCSASAAGACVCSSCKWRSIN